MEGIPNITLAFYAENSGSVDYRLSAIADWILYPGWWLQLQAPLQVLDELEARHQERSMLRGTTDMTWIFLQ
jgi:hypothetical protein